MADLARKVAVVTGAASGIGLHPAIEEVAASAVEGRTPPIIRPT
jgi:NAD(P)-dependent dehydrogenase (short-subunit alcohol dehydrogenase family)